MQSPIHQLRVRLSVREESREKIASRASKFANLFLIES